MGQNQTMEGDNLEDLDKLTDANYDDGRLWLDSKLISLSKSVCLSCYDG